MKSISVIDRRGFLLLIRVDGINSVVLDIKNGNLDIVFKYYGKLRRIADVHYSLFVGCNLYDFCRYVLMHNVDGDNIIGIGYEWYLSNNDWHRLISTLRIIYNQL